VRDEVCDEVPEIGVASLPQDSEPLTVAEQKQQQMVLSPVVDTLDVLTWVGEPRTSTNCGSLCKELARKPLQIHNLRVKAMFNSGIRFRYLSPLSPALEQKSSSFSPPLSHTLSDTL
jgi:hypothetical protein